MEQERELEKLEIKELKGKVKYLEDQVTGYELRLKNDKEIYGKEIKQLEKEKDMLQKISKIKHAFSRNEMTIILKLLVHYIVKVHESEEEEEDNKEENNEEEDK